MNKVELLGNLGQEIELRFTASGTPVANFSMATNEYWTGKDGEKKKKTIWHKIQVWGKEAENCKKALAKGSRILVEGSNENQKWEDKDGNTRYSYFVKARKVTFLDRSKSQNGAQEDLPLPEEPMDPSEITF